MEDAAKARLLAWYDRRDRDMPWRGRKDPYAVWVSEVMLQQTRVATVAPYFDAWMKRFPTVADLAAATDDEVIAAWSGLGYYRRARHLHAAARQLVAAGRNMPETARGLQTLPGIGPYTAAAVASIAFHEPIAAVDGNVERVMARLEAITLDVRKGAGRRAVREAADDWLDAGRPGDWNQALMDLGASICRPRAPHCGDCPLAVDCQAHREGIQAELPVLPGKAPPREERVHFVVVVQDGRLLVVKRPDDGLLAGTWALPGGGTDRDLTAWALEQAGVQVQLADSAASVRHVFTHRAWDMEVRSGHVLDVVPGATWPMRWVPLGDLAETGLSTAMRKALAAAGLPC